MIVGVMRKLCVWVDCKNPEALAACASMAAVGRSLRLNWCQRMCVSCTAYACAVFWVAKLCAMGGVNGNPNPSDLLGRATALACGGAFQV